MADQVRNPTSGQFANVAPKGAAVTNPPSLPQPGPAAHDCAEPLPTLAFNATPSPGQTLGDLVALGTAPGLAGPQPTIATTPMQDFGQAMGQTFAETASNDDAASSA